MLLAILEVGAIGLILGVLIGVAVYFFEVKTDPMVQIVYDKLPHINCGACGTPGCMAMANAVVKEGYPVNKCKPGTAEMKADIQKILDEYKKNLVLEAKKE